MSQKIDPFKDADWQDWKRDPDVTPPVLAPDYPRQAAPPAPGKFLNWGVAAQMLATGQPVEEVARQLGCEPQRIWRNLRRSRKFRARIQLAHERLRMQASLRFRNLGDRAVRQLERGGEKVDMRMLVWLADRLGLGHVPSDLQGVGDWFGRVAQGRRR